MPNPPERQTLTNHLSVTLKQSKVESYTFEAKVRRLRPLGVRSKEDCLSIRIERENPVTYV